MKPGCRVLAVVALLCGCAVGLQADEIKLKDGSKIIGVIVGFEDNAFRVKTSYGYALIQKDQVVSISVVDDKRTEPSAKPEAKAEEPPAPPRPASTEVAHEAPAQTPTSSVAPGSSKSSANGEHAVSSTAATASKPLAEPAASSTATNSPTVNSSKVAAKTAAAAQPAPTNTSPSASATKALAVAPAVSKPTPPNSAPTSTSASATPANAAVASATASSPAPAAAAALKPEPEPVREEVSGNTYVNRTWGFQMYKPPDWQVIDSARGMLPGAIMAMGTSDQRTYLLIGQEAAGKSLTSDMDAIEGRLREVVENYRLVGEKRVTIAGVTAVQHKFRGSIDNHDWSGVIVFIPRDSHLYTVFGMTYADTDLVQIQENVMSRAIYSLQFTKQ